MDASDPEGGGLEARRRRIHFRAWRRGMREMDLILGKFADAHLDWLAADELSDFELLLDIPDQEVYGWLTGANAPPMPPQSPLLDRLAAFHRRQP